MEQLSCATADTTEQVDEEILVCELSDEELEATVGKRAFFTYDYSTYRDFPYICC